MISKALEYFKAQKRHCFEKHRNRDDICYGLYDPDPMQDHLYSGCMDCEYLTVYSEKEGEK